MIRCAVIDVGTNSVKVLVADVAGRRVEPVFEMGKQTRLGAGFYLDQILSASAIAATTDCVAEFYETALRHGATRVACFATSVARDARNPEALATAIRTRTGLQLDVISGEQEAEWAYRGVGTGPEVDGPILVIDVGGGSVEFVWGSASGVVGRWSERLGAVRLKETLRPHDPPSAEDWRRCRETVDCVLLERVVPSVCGFRSGEGVNLEVMATGGTAGVLGMVCLGLTQWDPRRLEGVRLTLADVRRVRERLWVMLESERKATPGIPPDRADILIYGLGIYERFLDLAGLGGLAISTRGLRYGALLGTATPVDPVG